MYWEGVSYVVSILSPSFSQCRVDDDDDDDDGEDGEDGDDDDDGDDNDFIRNTIEKGLNIKSFIVINDDYIFIQSESFLLARLAG